MQLIYFTFITLQVYVWLHPLNYIVSHMIWFVLNTHWKTKDSVVDKSLEQVEDALSKCSIEKKNKSRRELVMAAIVLKGLLE